MKGIILGGNRATARELGDWRKASGRDAPIFAAIDPWIQGIACGIASPCDACV